jgi:hypothetical protein
MLTPEQKAAFAQAIGQPGDDGTVSGNDPAPASPSTPHTGEAVEAQASPDQTEDRKGSQTPFKLGQQTESGQTEVAGTATESKGPIPYDRFSKEVKKRRELERQVEYLRGQMEAAQRMGQQGWQADTAQGETQGQVEQDPVLTRLEQAELYMAEQKLDRLVTDTRKANPQLSEEFIYRAVASGAKSPADVQQAWNSLLQLVGQGTTQPPQAAAPTPPAPPSVKPAPRVQQPTKPRTMEEAKQAMKAFLQESYRG